jgi:hypothetical protein
MTSFVTKIYEYVLDYFIYRPEIEPCIDSSGSTMIILTPKIIFLREHEIYTREDIFQILFQNKEYDDIKFIVPKYYSNYLLSNLIFDILDILSNELFLLQTKMEFIFDPTSKIFMDEFKDNLRKNVSFLQKNKILPIYVKFLEIPSYHIQYSVSFDRRFHILFLKESEDRFSIQRLYFSIEL